jgi:hypothetical protein
VQRVATAGAFAVAVAAVVIAVLALHEARQPSKVPTQAEIAWSGVERFMDARDGTTPAEARALFGAPAEVFRDNPRALCWRYDSPFEIRMCWGPKRQAAWISASVPRGLGFDPLMRPAQQ